MDWLYLHLPQLQLDQLLLGEHAACALPEPVIIIAPRSQHIVQLNAAAHAAGLKTGMRLDTASALCHPLHVVEQHTQATHVLRDLARTLYPLCADIALFPEQGLLCRITPMLRLFGGLERYLSLISEWLAQQQLTAQQALAATPLAAKTLAEAGIDTRTLNTAQVAQLLQRLPLSALALSARVQQQLQRLGLRRVEDVLALPRAEIRLRLGAEVIGLLDQLLGQQQTPLHFYQPEPYFSQQLELGHEVEQATGLLFPLKKLLQQLQHFLQIAARSTQSLLLELSLRDGTTQSLTLHSAAPERQPERWLALAQLSFEGFRPNAPMIGLRLCCQQLLDLAAPTQDLFATRRQTLSAAQLVSRLQARLGESGVQQLHWQADHRPENAFVERAFMEGAVMDSTAVESNIDWVPPALLRPTLLLEQPQPLSETIRILHGPERIQSAWWTAQPVCRDYFVARNTAQQTLWVFRDQAQRWFVHGWFA